MLDLATRLAQARSGCAQLPRFALFLAFLWRSRCSEAAPEVPTEVQRKAAKRPFLLRMMGTGANSEGEPDFSSLIAPPKASFDYGNAVIFKVLCAQYSSCVTLRCLAIAIVEKLVLQFYTALAGQYVVDEGKQSMKYSDVQPCILPQSRTVTDMSSSEEYRPCTCKGQGNDAHLQGPDTEARLSSKEISAWLATTKNKDDKDDDDDNDEDDEEDGGGGNDDDNGEDEEEDGGEDDEGKEGVEGDDGDDDDEEGGEDDDEEEDDEGEEEDVEQGKEEVEGDVDDEDGVEGEEKDDGNVDEDEEDEDGVDGEDDDEEDKDDEPSEPPKKKRK